MLHEDELVSDVRTRSLGVCRARGHGDVLHRDELLQSCVFAGDGAALGDPG